MNRKGKITVIIFLISVFLITAVLFTSKYILAVDGKPTPMATAKIYAAATDIPQGTIIKSDMLMTIEIPAEQAREFMIFYAEDIVGTTARYYLQKGVIITKSMIVIMGDPLP